MPAPKDDKESFAALFEGSVGAAPAHRRVSVGQRLEVKIVAVGRDAVFADMGVKQEGYFERAELTGEDGQLRVGVGASVSAVVSDVDARTGQARLSPVFVRRAAGDDAVDASDDSDEALLAALSRNKTGPLLVEGARVRGKVTGIERYGVFVQIDGTSGRGGRGLIPTAETATPRGADLKRHFQKDQAIEAKIVSIDEGGKIRLSIKAVSADTEREEFQKFSKTEAKKPETRGFGTLGELLSNAKKT
jgi:small subunit ribosomal protein S1